MQKSKFGLCYQIKIPNEQLLRSKHSLHSLFTFSQHLTFAIRACNPCIVRNKNTLLFTVMSIKEDIWLQIKFALVVLKFHITRDRISRFIVNNFKYNLAKVEYEIVTLNSFYPFYVYFLLLNSERKLYGKLGRKEINPRDPCTRF